LALRRDWSDTGGYRDPDAGRDHSIRLTGLLRALSPPAAIRGARPSSFWAVSYRRVSGGSRLSGAAPRA
jgi:hypothetical protein